MADFNMTPASTSPVTLGTAERVTAFLRSVYGWMFAGLGVTALVAVAVAGSPAIVQLIASNQILFLGLVLGELGLVFYLSGRAPQLVPNVAVGLFVLYSALNGVTLSLILLMYTGASIATILCRHGRDIRGIGAVRLDDAAELGRRGPVLLHGADRLGPRVGGRHVLAQRGVAVPDLRRGRACVHWSHRLGRTTLEADGVDHPG